MNFKRNMTNGKPYRNAGQRDMLAQKGAVWKTADGHYRSDVPVSYHPPVK
jgi:hypothetical protein